MKRFAAAKSYKTIVVENRRSGFIDNLFKIKESTTVYTYYDHEWRDIDTGKRADIFDQFLFDDLIKAKRFLDVTNKIRQEEKPQ
jgi:hypothetical protein